MGDIKGQVFETQAILRENRKKISERRGGGLRRFAGGNNIWQRRTASKI